MDRKEILLMDMEVLLAFQSSTLVKRLLEDSANTMLGWLLAHLEMQMLQWEWKKHWSCCGEGKEVRGSQK